MWEPRHENVSGFVVQYDEQAYLTCSTYNDFQRFSISTLLPVKDFFSALLSMPLCHFSPLLLLKGVKGLNN